MVGGKLVVESCIFRNISTAFILSDDQVDIRNCTFDGMVQPPNQGVTAQFLYMTDSFFDALTEYTAFFAYQVILTNSTIYK